MKLFLEEPSMKHKEFYEDMMEEWEKFGGRLHPGALRRYSSIEGKNVTYEKWLKWIAEDRNKDSCPKGTIPQDLYFMVNETGRIIGAISIRKVLEDEKIEIDGHLGVGIRPSERNKGYATKMIEMALTILKSMGVIKLIYTCDEDNIGSSKAIINNGGVLENEFIDDNGNKKLKYFLMLE